MTAADVSGDAAPIRGYAQHYVVRGGLSASETLRLGASELARMGLPGRYGISASSAPPPATVAEIATAADYPHPWISFTTVSRLHALRYLVVPTPTLANPLHASVLLLAGRTSLSERQAKALSSLFVSNRLRNPACRRR